MKLQIRGFELSTPARSKLLVARLVVEMPPISLNKLR